MQIKKNEFLELCNKIDEFNLSAGRTKKSKAVKKLVSVKFYDRTALKLDKFAKKNNLSKNQILEALVELLPYIELM